MKEAFSTETVRRLVSEDQVSQALRAALDLFQGGDREANQELVVLAAKWKKLQKQERRGILSPSETERARAKIIYALLSLVDEFEAESGKQGGEKEGQGESGSGAEKPTVFLSYNHGDAAVAGKLRKALEAKGIAVRIDSQHMKAGESIEAFIRRSIRESDLTLGLVSDRSLLSGWVAVETISTLWEEKSRGERRFIAGYLEDAFFSPGYRLEATRRIDARLAEIDDLMAEYLKEGLDTVDLNAERSRWLHLRQGLGDILARLRDSLGLDLREEHFGASVDRIVAAVLSPEGVG